MMTLENLFLQIFDRKNQIEDQLRQQAQSYYQSLASNLLAEGRNPPPWLWSAVPHGTDCGPPQDMCREQFISGVLTSFPQAATPSVSRNFLFSQSILKEYSLQPNLFGETCVPATLLSTGICEESEKHLSIHDSGNSKHEDADTSQNPILSSEGQTLCTEPQSQKIHERSANSSKERQSMKDSGQKTQSGESCVNLHNMEDSSKLYSSPRYTSESNRKIVDGKSVSPKLLDAEISGQLLVQSGQDRIPKSLDGGLTNFMSQNHDECPETKHQNGFIFEDQDLSTNSQKPCTRQRHTVSNGMSEDTGKGMVLRKGIGHTLRLENLPAKLDMENSSVSNTSATSSVFKDKISRSKSSSSKQVDSQILQRFTDQVGELGSEALDKQTNFTSQSIDACPTLNHPACNIRHAPEKDYSNSQLNLRPSPVIMNVHAETRLSFVGSVNDSLDGKFDVSPEIERHHDSPQLYDDISPIDRDTTITDFELSKQPIRIEPVTEDIDVCEEVNRVLEINQREVDEILEIKSLQEPLGDMVNSDLHHDPFSSENMLSQSLGDMITSTTSVVTEQVQILDFPVHHGTLTDLSFGTNGHGSDSCMEEAFGSLKKLVDTDHNRNQLSVIEIYEEPAEVEKFESVNRDAMNADTCLHDNTPVPSLPKKISEGKCILSHPSTPDKNQITALSISSQVVTSGNSDQSKCAKNSQLYDSSMKGAAFSVPNILTPFSLNEPKQCFAKHSKANTSDLSSSRENNSATFLPQELKEYSSNELCQGMTTLCNNITPTIPELLSTQSESHGGSVLDPEAPNTMGTIQPPKARYFLRRSTRLSKEISLMKPSHCDRSQDVTSHDSCVTWPKERKRNRQSSNVFHTTSKVKRKPVLVTNGCIDVTQLNSSRNTSDCLKETNSRMLQDMTKSPFEDTPSEHQKLEDAPSVIEENQPCQDIPELACSYERNHEILECATDDTQSRSSSASDCCTYLKGYPVVEHLNEVDFCLKSSPTEQIDVALSSGSQPELEGFSFGAGVLKDAVTSAISDSKFSLRRSASFLEGIRASKDTHTPLCNSSTKFAVHNVPGIYSSLPSGLLEQFNLSDSLHFSDGNNTISKDGTVIHFYGNRVSDPDCYMRKGMPEDMPRSSMFELDAKRFFTPPIQKQYHKITLERSGCSSGKISSNPELVCFRIDENCSMDEEGVLPDKNEAMSQEMEISSENTAATSRMALADVTSFYQNVPTMASISGNHPERGSLDSVSTEAYFESDVNVMKTIGKGKENPSSSCKSVPQKCVKTLRNRPSKRKISAKEKDQEQSLASSTKKRKPSNIVSSMPSFVPLVQQKQTAAGPGKKDIKVKALEAAEAAKRLEEKKQKEREMRKEAVRLERVRMEQENIRLLELERKQKDEERRRKEAVAEARKRQREEEARKEKERKRKCNDARRQQHEDKTHNDKKELRAKDAAKNFAKKEAKTRSTSEKGSGVIDTVRRSDLEQTSTCEIDQHIFDGGEVTTSLGMERDGLVRTLVMKESRESESYEISPYRDSDNEVEEDNKQKRKLIPKWARRETAALILASQRLTDLENVFLKKRSCKLDEVYQVPLRLGPFDRTFRI